MPKYVFEMAITLPSDQELTVPECNSINTMLVDRLSYIAVSFGKSGGRISAEQPFEQVTSDWIKTDNGEYKAGPSRPIDYDG